jgi:hypothetical protein
MYLDSTNDIADGQPTDGTVVERCRSMFRQIGRRVSSFDLSRQIYG